jgi:hypothetical protein
MTCRSKKGFPAGSRKWTTGMCQRFSGPPGMRQVFHVTSLQVFHPIPKHVRLRAEHRRGSFLTRPLPIRAT